MYVRPSQTAATAAGSPQIPFACLFPFFFSSLSSLCFRSMTMHVSEVIVIPFSGFPFPAGYGWATCWCRPSTTVLTIIAATHPVETKADETNKRGVVSCARPRRRLPRDPCDGRIHRPSRQTATWPAHHLVQQCGVVSSTVMAPYPAQSWCCAQRSRGVALSAAMDISSDGGGTRRMHALQSGSVTFGVVVWSPGAAWPRPGELGSQVGWWVRGLKTEVAVLRIPPTIRAEPPQRCEPGVQPLASSPAFSSRRLLHVWAGPGHRRKSICATDGEGADIHRLDRGAVPRPKQTSAGSRYAPAPPHDGSMRACVCLPSGIAWRGQETKNLPAAVDGSRRRRTDPSRVSCSRCTDPSTRRCGVSDVGGWMNRLGPPRVKARAADIEAGISSRDGNAPSAGRATPPDADGVAISPPPASVSAQPCFKVVTPHTTIRYSFFFRDVSAHTMRWLPSPLFRVTAPSPLATPCVFPSGRNQSQQYRAVGISAFVLFSSHRNRNGLWKWRGSRTYSLLPARPRPSESVVRVDVSGPLCGARTTPRFRARPHCDVHQPTRKRASRTADCERRRRRVDYIQLVLRGWFVHVTDNHAGQSPSPLACTPSAALPMTGRGGLCSCEDALRPIVRNGVSLRYGP